MLEHPYRPGQFLVLPVNLAAPVAGADMLYSVPPGYLYELCSISFLLTTDANIANRYVSLNVEDTVPLIFFKSLLPTALTAGGTNQLSFGAGYCWPSSGVAHTPTAGSWPNDFLVPRGLVFAIRITNGQVGDTITNIRAVFKQWFSP